MAHEYLALDDDVDLDRLAARALEWADPIKAKTRAGFIVAALGDRSGSGIPHRVAALALAPGLLQEGTTKERARVRAALRDAAADPPEEIVAIEDEHAATLRHWAAALELTPVGHDERALLHDLAGALNRHKSDLEREITAYDPSAAELGRYEHERVLALKATRDCWRRSAEQLLDAAKNIGISPSIDIRSWSGARDLEVLAQVVRLARAVRAAVDAPYGRGRVLADLCLRVETATGHDAMYSALRDLGFGLEDTNLGSTPRASTPTLRALGGKANSFFKKVQEHTGANWLKAEISVQDLSNVGKHLVKEGLALVNARRAAAAGDPAAEKLAAELGGRKLLAGHYQVRDMRDSESDPVEAKRNKAS